MKLIPKALFVVYVAASLFRTGLLAGQSLEIRVAPSDVIYTNQNNRRTGIYDIMVQTISVINNSDRSVTLEEILIEVVEEGDVILTDRLLAKNYEPVWKAFYPYFSNPETQKSDNSLVLFSEVLPEGVTVSPTLTLGPNTAILVRNRLLALSGYILPDTVRVSATLADAAGKLETAETSLPVVRYEARNEFIFPLRGRWYVSSSSSIRSHHRARPAHEFALDLMKIGEGGRSFRTDGSSPEDYYAFGKDVLAIADGNGYRRRERNSGKINSFGTDCLRCRDIFYPIRFASAQRLLTRRGSWRRRRRAFPLLDMKPGTSLFFPSGGGGM